MPKLPQVKPRDLVKVIEKRGFVARKTKSGHVFFQHPSGKTTGILKQTGISLEELLDEL